MDAAFCKWSDATCISMNFIWNRFRFHKVGLCNALLRTYLLGNMVCKCTEFKWLIVSRLFFVGKQNTFFKRHCWFGFILCLIMMIIRYACRLWIFSYENTACACDHTLWWNCEHNMASYLLTNFSVKNTLISQALTALETWRCKKL